MGHVFGFPKIWDNMGLGFPKIRGTFLGVPVKRKNLLWSTFGVPRFRETHEGVWGYIGIEVQEFKAWGLEVYRLRGLRLLGLGFRDVGGA